ncbi:hypothetical protein PSN45_005215 [Yamadazyma tenuis]|uniref:Amino acid transporter transmembrane domain-containing protein n=1 Tax=Candida tenuis (strain ATCC 10573 / BCRC 21748 / CBS 615 / JCM 9827 / NBRC 10315 / NRRL Y-1498 / VKM Y-70) TaxID=590646 RepID=G3B124_CANTC|nr:uncharacterized protein CANTEDRAFT_113626 [Yamadazyma tenuis ATCC 10573]XP_006685961.1 uncharacterized protein CANTEDRAFT_113626 [Yamadazyma tenuis ATCC 10573]EGV65154.1 hypothetical protein CANTEDRAFT_113626 [Yamadazyma tenuis ATCC 10573]EGV65155.1 hypothetical protein CANTEDRAFT_113626 [Yamadazyma tenuis ATCC 10573]WEJ97658.1 hypothetical protein PSN45_005215 [Yamadazyma tenuis]
MATATIQSGTINLLNTIIGAGILAMPYGLKSNGLAFGLLLIVWSALTSSFGLYLQTKVSKYTDQQTAVSFFSLSKLTYPSLSVVFDAAIAIKCFGVGISYLVIIGDLMPKIVEALASGAADQWWNHRNTWISVFMIFVAPLSFLRKLDSLKYTSVVALFSVLYLICLVVFHYFFGEGSETSAPEIEWFGPISWRSTLRSFPIFVFAYTCHQNMFAIINELAIDANAGSKTRQSNHVIRNAIATACVSYTIVAVSGYLTFGSAVNGNIITMYPKNSMSSLVGRLCIVVMVALSFPLQCHPCRGSLNHVVYFIVEKFKRDPMISEEHDALIEDDSGADNSFVSTTPMEGAYDTAGHDPIVVPLTSRNFYYITTGIVVFSYLIAISITSLEHVLALVGSTGSTSISFVLPGLFGYLLIKPKPGQPATILEQFCKYGGLCLCLWGLLVMVVCLSATLFLGATH